MMASVSVRAGEEERGGGRRHGRGDPGDEFVPDDTRPARHVRHEPERGGAVGEGKARLGYRLDAADFDLG